MKNVLVAGGAGFIGYHFCKRLLDEGYKVVCVDNFVTGSSNNVLTHENYSLTTLDICRLEGFLVSDLRFDYVINLACPASPVHYMEFPFLTIDSNTTGVINLADLACEHGAVFVQASTSEVYGDPLEHPQKEPYFGNVNPFGPRACYDEGKRIAESILYNYWKEHNLQIKIMRIFNTYGSHMQVDDGRVISNFIMDALMNQPLQIYGDGLTTRSFCYVDDLIDGFMFMLNSSNEVTGPINFGNPNETTLQTLAELIIGLTKSNSEIVYKTKPQDDPLVRRPDITLAKKTFGWKPKVTLIDGLVKTIDYFKKEYENALANERS
jgi:UDP-glucuronate decarboxylase